MSSKKSLNSSKKVQNILYKYDDVKSLLDVSKATFYNYKKQGLLDLKIREAKNKKQEQLSTDTRNKQAEIEVSTSEELKQSIIRMMATFSTLISKVDFDKLSDHDKLNFTIQYMQQLNNFTLATKGLVFEASPVFQIHNKKDKLEELELRHQHDMEILLQKHNLKQVKK